MSQNDGIDTDNVLTSFSIEPAVNASHQSAPEEVVQSSSSSDDDGPPPAKLLRKSSTPKLTTKKQQAKPKKTVVTADDEMTRFNTLNSQIEHASLTNNNASGTQHDLPADDPRGAPDYEPVCKLICKFSTYYHKL